MKKKLIIGGVVLTAIALLVTVNVMKSRSTGTFSKGKAVEVKVVNAKVQDINATVSVNGVVEEADKEELYFDTSVKVNNVFIEKDDKVTKGQRLFEFDLDELYSQLNQAKINLNIQIITLNKIEDSLRLQNTSQAESTLEQAKITMEQAKSNLDRVQQLYNIGAASYTEFENAKTQYDNARLQYTTAQNNLDDIYKNNSDLSSNTSKDIKNQKEQIRLTELKIQDLETKINKLVSQSVSPIDGVISELNVQKGSITSPSTKAVKIINPDHLELKLEVKEVDILKVKEGQMVEITGDAFPDKKINGTVKSIGMVATKKQGVNNSDEAFVLVTVSADNTEKLMRPGLSVNAKIITDTRKNVVVVPFDVFQEDKDGNKWVFTAENGIAKQKSIKTGISSNLDLEVVSGLTGNEVLIKDPPSRLKDGMKIIVQDAKNK